MKKIINLVLLFVVVGITCMIGNVSAAVIELKTGTYSSKDGHTIVINADKTVSYDGTYNLTLTEKEKGSTITGKLGTDKKAVTMYQLNDSKIVTGNGHVTYKHGGVATYLYNYTVFSTTSSAAAVLENSGIELYRDGTKVNSYADFQSAVDAANNGDTIKITKDINVSSGAYINKNLNIDGNGKTINTKNWANGLFIVEKGFTVDVKDLTVDGGSNGFEVNYDAVTFVDFTIPLVSGSDSSDIKQAMPVFVNAGNLKITNSNFNNNYTATDSACIGNISGNLNVTNSNFIHNRASRGAAIAVGNYFENGQNEYPVNSVIIDNCNFEKNYSSNGGAIYAYNFKNLKVTNSNFISNTVTGGYGGAIMFNKQSSTAVSKGLDFVQAQIDNCLFDGNWTGNDGFAVQNYDAELTTTNSVFTNNVGTHPSSSVATYSMQVTRDEWAEEKVIGCTFENNRGPVSGIADHGGHVLLTVDECDFKENYGMATVYVLTSVVHINNCSFENEHVTKAVIEGASYSELSEYDTIEYKNPTVILEDTTFKNCGLIDALSSIRGFDVPFNLIIRGKVIGNIDVRDNSLLTLDGELEGNVTLDRNTLTTNILGEGKVIGETISKTGYYLLSFRYNYGSTKQVMNYDQVVIYLEENKTYTEKEILEALQFIGKDNYKFEYYTDAAYTQPWDFTLTANETIHGKLVPHNHVYDQGLVAFEHGIYKQCECGYIGDSLTIDIKDEILDNEANKAANIINELGINESDYIVSYMKKNSDGTWSNHEGVPSKIGQYKVVLTYNNLVAEKIYAIAEGPVNIPNTFDGIGNLVLMVILGIIGLGAVTVFSLKVKENIQDK